MTSKKKNKKQVSSFPDNHFIDEYARFLFLDTKDKNAAVANSMNYMTKKGERLLLLISMRNAPAYINMNNGGFLLMKSVFLGSFCPSYVNCLVNTAVLPVLKH